MARNQRSPGSLALAAAATGPIISVTSPTSTGVVNLTAVGTLDWATWPNGVFTHKAGGNKITNVTRIGTGTFGTWADNRISLSWSDGTPTGSATGSQGLIYCNGQGNSGWSFRAPADTTTRKLHVLCGGSNGATFRIRADLSDNSFAAPIITKTDSSPSGYTLLEYIITYRAASAGQNIKITLTHTLTSYQSVDLEAAWLTLDTTGGGGGGGGGGTPNYPTVLTNAGITGATLSFSDEFDGPLSASPDGPPNAKWGYVDSHGYGISQEQYNSGNYLKIANSVVSLVNINGYAPCLVSANKESGAGFMQKYGYWETRMRIPPGPGTWGGFWLAVDDPHGTQHPQAFELDISEDYTVDRNANGSSRAYMTSTVHVWGSNESDTWILEYGDWYDGMGDAFHVYSCLWTPDVIIMYIDGTEVDRCTPTTQDVGPVYILFTNVYSGSPQNGTPDAVSPLDVDWVRVWKLP